MPRRQPLSIVSVVIATVLVAVTCLIGVAPAMAASAGDVSVGGASLPITAVDKYRPADSLVVYTPASGAASPANQWGAEAVVRAGLVTELRDRQTGVQTATPIPADGLLLSGHGTARDWLLNHARVGASVRLPASLTPAGWPTDTPPPPPTSCSAGVVELTFDDGPSATTTASILDTLAAKDVDATFYVLGQNAVSHQDLLRRAHAEGHELGNHTWSHLDLPTAPSQTVTPTNVWGAEVVVTNGKVTAVYDRQSTNAGSTTIPGAGYVLSGHGTARTWLLANLRVGTSVSLPVAPTAMAGRSVTAGRSTFTVSAVNEGRGADQLVLYSKLTADDVVLSELSRTSAQIEAATGKKPTLWRPPQSRYNSHIVDLASSLGLTMRLFDLDSNDWVAGATAEQITATVLAGAHDGAVVDLHDTTAATATALPGIIDGLRSAGYCLS